MSFIFRLSPKKREAFVKENNLIRKLTTMGPVPEIVRGNMDPSSNDYTLKALQLTQCAM